MLPATSLTLHPDLLEHAPRGGVVLEVAGVNTIEAQLLEAETENRLSGLRGQASAPVRLPDPVAHLCLPILLIQLQADRSDQLSGSERVIGWCVEISAQLDREHNGLAARSSLGLGADPCLRQPFLVRVRDIRRGRRDLALARQFSYPWRIIGTEGSKDQTPGQDLG
jgi:hypothetical protein